MQKDTRKSGAKTDIFFKNFQGVPQPGSRWNEGQENASI